MYIYQVNQVRPTLIILAEESKPLYERIGLTPHVNSMALVIGANRAALVDTGMGYGQLDAWVRRYTSLPVIVLTSHGDGDHIGANHQFDACYMSELDDNLVKAEKRFPYQNITDGMIFDLGGIQLEAIALPGHTKGSMCFLDRGNNELFTGDGVNKLPWLFLERCTPLRVYLQGLERLRDMTPDQPTIYCGHSLEGFPYQVLLDSITACQDVIAGKSEEVYPYYMPFAEDAPIMADVFEHQVGDVRLCYNVNQL